MAIESVLSLKALLGRFTTTFLINGGTYNNVHSDPKRWTSLWTTSTPDTPATPSTAQVCTSSNPHAIPLVNGGDGTLFLASAEFATQVGSTAPTRGNAGGMWMLYDRLSHMGGLSGTDVTTMNSSGYNLPTAALTRYTSGVGVMAALEIHNSVGSTQVSATVSYTNQDGTAGKTSLVKIGGATGGPQNSGIETTSVTGTFILIPLSPGDTGIKSVESVTLSASTGTPGDFGVTLFKPLALFPACLSNDMHVYEILDGLFPVEVVDDACLTLACVNNAVYTNKSAMSYFGSLGFIEA